MHSDDCTISYTHVLCVALVNTANFKDSVRPFIRRSLGREEEESSTYFLSGKLECVIRAVCFSYSGRMSEIAYTYIYL